MKTPENYHLTCKYNAGHCHDASMCGECEHVSLLDKCPNPECEREYWPEYNKFAATITCGSCGASGPNNDNEGEARRLWNLLPRQEIEMSNESENNEMVTISKKEYVNLKDCQMQLRALERGGVDNWEWYEDSMEGYWQMKEVSE